MARYTNCSCGGLKIDNDTLKVNDISGQLYVSATVGGEVPVYKALTDIGYTEPTGTFNPAEFDTYCTNFSFGSKFVGVNLPDVAYPKLSAFITLAIGDAAFFDEVTTTLTIENHRDGNGNGAIRYTLTNGLPVTPQP